MPNSPENEVTAHIQKSLQTIGGRVKFVRELRKLDQKDLAAAAGVTVSAISQIERNETKSPSALVMHAICGALAANPDWILQGRGPMLLGDPTPQDEGEILAIIRDMTPEARAALLAGLRASRKQ